MFNYSKNIDRAIHKDRVAGLTTREKFYMRSSGFLIGALAVLGIGAYDSAPVIAHAASSLERTIDTNTETSKISHPLYVEATALGPDSTIFGIASEVAAGTDQDPRNIQIEIENTIGGDNPDQLTPDELVPVPPNNNGIGKPSSYFDSGGN